MTRIVACAQVAGMWLFSAVVPARTRQSRAGKQVPRGLIRSGPRMIVEAAPGIGVLAEAADGEQAVAQVRQLRPDVGGYHPSHRVPRADKRGGIWD